MSEPSLIPAVRAYRILLGLTQDEAATAAGCGLRTYKYWESRGERPQWVQDNLAKAWGLPPRALDCFVPDLPYKEIVRLVDACGGIRGLAPGLRLLRSVRGSEKLRLSV